VSGDPDAGAVATVLAHFDLGGAVAGVAPAAEGHINRSWVVTLASAPTPLTAQPGPTVRPHTGTPAQFLLQRINETVFPAPEQVMGNVERVTRHLAAALAREGASEPERRALRLVPTREGAAFHRDREGGVWRVYPFIAGTTVREHVATRAEAREVGRAFGTFQRLLAGYDGPRLHDTIPHFHDTARRVAALERSVADDRVGRAAGATAEIESALARRELAAVLPPLLTSGAVPERIAHNDAKSSNVLLDQRTGQALCVVDLDTVMPGSALYDFGDMVRSATSPTPEDERDLERVRVHVPLFEGVAEGYLAAAWPTLVPAERDLLVFSGELIAFEQAVRFLTDHLDGDRYYRTAYAGHNLVRCRTQLALLANLERRRDEFSGILDRALPR
jgi:aminoglycoside phosphotransferase (APT) family kinase protein